jgi:hypothetical protein
VFRTRTAGTRALVVAVTAAAIAAGSAAASAPILAIPVQARLAPVAGASSTGHFSGVLARTATDAQPAQTPALPRKGIRWRLRWSVSLPHFGGPAEVTLRIASAGSAAAVVRVLSARCSGSARGTMTLTGSQAARVARGDAVVMVRAPSATLRGVVRAQRSPSPQLN